MAAKSYPPGTVLMRPMLDALARSWPLILLRGILSVLFGALTLVWPGVTLLTLVLLYGAYALIDGVISLGTTFSKGAPGHRWWLAVSGIVGIVAGLVTLIWPQITGFVLLLFMAAWAIASGALHIVGAIRLRKEIEDEWLLITGGVLSVLFGLLILAFPAASALGIATAIGSFAIIYGALMIALAFKLKTRAEVKI